MLQAVLLLTLIGLIMAWSVGPVGPKGTVEGFVDTDEDTEVIDNPLDLPWIASWSDADRAARAGQLYLVLARRDGPDGTVIETVHPSCESGMPHTRPGDRIVCPLGTDTDSDVITHELVHITQRREPERWRRFYETQWGFTFHTVADATHAGVPVAVLAARRSNPDTYDGGDLCCWQGRFWPLCVYRSITAPSLRSADTVWWDTDTRTLLRSPPDLWTAFFGTPAQDEHPHEIAATLQENTTTEAGRRLKLFLA